MPYKLSSITTARLKIASLALLLVIFSFGCASAPDETNSTANVNQGQSENTNPTVGANADAVSNSSAASTSDASATPSPTSASSPPTKEPERYSLTMTIGGETASDGKQAPLPSQQIDFAKKGADRRWAMQVPGIGPFVYLEKSGLKYLVFPARNQYVEVSPQELGIRPGDLLTPTSIVDRLKARAQLERLGNETVNGRSAIKYRIAMPKEADAKEDQAQAENFVYIDVDTGLPLRAEITFSTPNGVTARGVVETLDLGFNPDPTLFEVPEGMKKVTPEQAKQQIQRFSVFVRLITSAINRQSSAAPAPNSNSNANRRQ